MTLKRISIPVIFALSYINPTSAGTEIPTAADKVEDTLIDNVLGAEVSLTPQILTLPSVLEYAKNNIDISDFASLMRNVGAESRLEKSRDMTLFIPTNKAFEKFEKKYRLLSNGRYSEEESILNSLPWSIRWQIFTNHIVPSVSFDFHESAGSSRNKSSISNIITELTSWYGDTLKLTRRNISAPRENRNDKQEKVDQQYFINGKTAIAGDKPYSVETSNGIIYFIDSILVPDGLNLSKYVALAKGNSTDGTMDGRENHLGGVDLLSNPDTAIMNIEDGDIRYHDIPPFVQEGNMVHSLWNESPQKRRESLKLLRGPTVHKSSVRKEAAQANSETKDFRKQLGITEGQVNADTAIAESLASGNLASASQRINMVASSDMLLHDGLLLSPSNETQTSVYPQTAIRPLSISTGDIIHPENFGWAPSVRGWESIHASPQDLVAENASSDIYSDPPSSSQALKWNIVVPYSLHEKITTTNADAEKTQEFPFVETFRSQVLPAHILASTPGLLPSGVLAQGGAAPLSILSRITAT